MLNEKLSQYPFNNTYKDHLSNLGSFVSPKYVEHSEWIIKSHDVQTQLGISDDQLNNWLSALTGHTNYPELNPIAQKYAGHQFGHYNPQLGDGRGLLFGEIDTPSGRFDIHLKGAGQTPYSRFGDGNAVLRSCIREFLASEFLHHLGIPTSRALGLFLTNEKVQRETIEPGAAMVRVCESHIRFGHFEHAFYQNDTQLLTQLVEYTYEYVLPDEAKTASQELKDKALAIFEFTITQTAHMVAKWQAFGFCHGVMNTDNMSILGMTFDFGPYGFLDQYDPSHICNHSDDAGRYAYDEQPGVALWNLNALGHALSPLLTVEQLQLTLKQYEPQLLSHYSDLMRQKLGLTTSQEQDRHLLGELLAIMQKDQRDYTNTWRLLSNISFNENEHVWRDHFVSRDIAQAWLHKYKQRVQKEKLSEIDRQSNMKAINPKYILRNYLAQQVIEKASIGDYAPLHELYSLLSRPFDEQMEHNHYAAEPPEWSRSLSISCSS